MSLLSYKGYTAKVEYGAHESILYGHVLDVRDTITFQSESATEIVDEFHTSVDEYLSFCAEEKIEPAKPYSGKLFIRTSAVAFIGHPPASGRRSNPHSPVSGR